MLHNICNMHIPQQSFSHYITFSTEYQLGWPKSYIYTPYMTVYLVVSLLAKNTVYTPYMYGSGQP